MRLLALQIADRNNEIDVEKVLALPMWRLLEWAAFYKLEAEAIDRETAQHQTAFEKGLSGAQGRQVGAPSGRVKMTDPEALRKLFEMRYGS